MKTMNNESSVLAHLETLTPVKRRDEGLAMLKFMSQLTPLPPRLWGGSIIGYGSFPCEFSTGKANDWFLTGFSPRKSHLAIYFLPGLDSVADLLPRLGKCKTGHSSIHIPSLDQVDRSALARIIQRALDPSRIALVAC